MSIPSESSSPHESAPDRRGEKELLVLAGGKSVSLAFDVVSEFSTASTWVDVPGTADWCLGLVQWRGRLLTLLDAGLLFGDRPTTAQDQVVLSGLGVDTVLAVDELVDVCDESVPRDVELDARTLSTHPAFQPGAAAGAASRECGR